MAAAYLLHPEDFLKELEVGIKESVNSGREEPRYSNHPVLLGWGPSEQTVLKGPACSEAPMQCGVPGMVRGLVSTAALPHPLSFGGAAQLVCVCASGAAVGSAVPGAGCLALSWGLDFAGGLGFRVTRQV